MKIAAVDLGGTAVKGACLHDGNVLRRASAPTVATSRETVLRSLREVIDKLLPADAVALSSAGDIDPYRGVCTYATDNLPAFTGFALKRYLEETYGLPAEVINDGHAALLGEAAARALSQPTVMLTLGTGVGGAYFDGQQIVFGSDFRFGRFGHLPLYENGLPCNCGRQGCIETYVSGSALKRNAARLGLTVEQLFAADTGAAAAEVDRFCCDLAAALERVHEVAPYTLCILGGGVTRSSERWLPVLRKYTSRAVTTAVLGEDAGLQGAAQWWRERNK